MESWKLSKKRGFWIYAFITALILFLARINLPELTLNKMQVVNFGLISKPLRVALLNANVIFFDYASIIFARSEADPIENFLLFRKVNFKKRWQAFDRKFLEYLIPVILIHMFLYNSRNWIISSEILAGFIIMWIVLVGLPMYKLLNWIRYVLVAVAIGIFRVLV